MSVHIYCGIQVYLCDIAIPAMVAWCMMSQSELNPIGFILLSFFFLS